MQRPHRNQTGFTLIELIIVIVVVAIIGAIVASVLISGVDVYNYVSFTKEAQQNARIALQRLNREVRKIRNRQSIVQANDNSLQFIDYDGSTITYSFSNGKAWRNSDILVDNVQNFEFQYWRADGTLLSSPVDPTSDIWKITLSITVNEGEHSVTLTSQIFPRNFYTN